MTMVNGYSGSILDNFTDSYMLSIAVFENDEPVMIRAMKNYYAMESVDSLPFDSLYSYLNGGSCYGENYAWYWHGYLVILKPLLLLFSYSDLRILNMILISMLILYVTRLCHDKLPKGVATVFGVTFMFMMPLTILLCLDMANMFYIVLLSMIFLLKRKDFWMNSEKSMLFFMIIGMSTSYMDFLTYPMITLGIPLVTYMTLQVVQNKKAINCLAFCE